MQSITDSVPQLCLLERHCVAHMLQLVWDSGSRKSLANPLYQCCQLLANALTNGKLVSCVESFALEADMLVGVQPPQPLAFNQFVLNFTYRRRLRTQSFFTHLGGQRHDAVGYAAMCAEIDESCCKLTDGFSGSWLQPRVTHTCWGELPGSRCCATIAAAQERTRSSLWHLAVGCVGALGKSRRTNGAQSAPPSSRLPRSC